MWSVNITWSTFLEKTYQECSGETIPRPFREKTKLSICISTLALQCFIQFVFIVCQVEGYQNMLKLSSKQLAFTSYKAFLKKQRRSGTSFPASFSAWFWRKIYFSVLFTEKNSLSGCFYFVRHWVICVLEILC